MLKTERTKKTLTSRQLRNLDIEISFLEGLVRRDPKYEDALQVLGEDYSQRGRHQDGLKVDRRLVRLRSNDCYAHYNLACSYARTRKYKPAIASLERALDLGYCDFRWLSRDPDLRELRKQPVYRRIREKVRSKRVRIE